MPISTMVSGSAWIRPGTSNTWNLYGTQAMRRGKPGEADEAQGLGTWSIDQEASAVATLFALYF
jgi:hypothetical protein